MHPKDADILANSEDPDQVLLWEQSDAGLHFRQTWLSENIG